MRVERCFAATFKSTRHAHSTTSWASPVASQDDPSFQDICGSQRSPWSHEPIAWPQGWSCITTEWEDMGNCVQISVDLSWDTDIWCFHVVFPAVDESNIHKSNVDIKIIGLLFWIHLTSNIFFTLIYAYSHTLIPHWYDINSSKWIRINSPATTLAPEMLTPAAGTPLANQRTSCAEKWWSKGKLRGCLYIKWVWSIIVQCENSNMWTWYIYIYIKWVYSGKIRHGHIQYHKITHLKLKQSQKICGLPSVYCNDGKMRITWFFGTSPSTWITWFGPPEVFKWYQVNSGETIRNKCC